MREKRMEFYDFGDGPEPAGVLPDSFLNKVEPAFAVVGRRRFPWSEIKANFVETYLRVKDGARIVFRNKIG